MGYSNLIDMSIEEYHNHPAISRSGVMLFKKSPLHFWNRYFNHEVEEKNSSALILGNAFHALILEPKLFEDKYCIAPKVDKRTSAGKEELARFEAANFGKVLLSQEQYEQIFHMSESVSNSKIAYDLIKQGMHEKSAFWTDSKTDVQCKCRPDILTLDMVCDIKTSSDASYQAFQRDIYNYGYHIQAAMISDGLLSACDANIDEFIFIVIEKEPPYAVAIYCLNKESIELGRKEYQEVLDQYKDCRSKNEWPGYKTREITLPAYAFI